MRQLQASGMVLEQYEDAVYDGLPQRLQCRVAASSITYSQSLDSATVTEAYGEFFIKGSMAYQFVAQEAAISCNQPTGVIKVTDEEAVDCRGLRDQRVAIWSKINLPSCYLGSRCIFFMSGRTGHPEA